MDLGHLDSAAPAANFVAVPGSVFVLSAGPVTTHSHFTDGILRGGLSYKFY
jgi:hypothetical protein